MSIEKDYCTKKFELAVHISCKNKASGNDTDLERILSKMGIQGWICWEVNEAHPSERLICVGLF